MMHVWHSRGSAWGRRLGRGGIGLVAGCAAAMLIGGLGVRFGWWPYGAGLQVVRTAAWAVLAALPIGVLALGLALRAADGRARRLAAGALLCAVAVGAYPAYLYQQLGQVPHIHDITTDTDNPPAFVAALPMRKGQNPLDASAEVIALQRQGYPDIAPARLDAAPAAAFERAERAARAMGWQIVASVPAEGRIEATDTSLLFGFKDDIVVRVAAQGAGSRVDVRSASRVGRGDFGVNAARIRKYLAGL
jgi:uncharacterized protein (DUF1499 family)